MGNLKWTLLAIGFQTGLAYLVSLVIYQLGLVLLYGQAFSFWTGIALLVLASMLYFILRKPRQVKEEIITLENLPLADKL